MHNGRSRFRRWGWALPLLYFPADYLFSRWVARRHRRWEKTLTRDADGVRLGCAAFTVGTGRDALLLIHGFADTPAVFRPMAGDLAARGWVCRAMRLPGAGETLERLGAARLADWRRAVATELAALRREYRRVFAVGHSLGGTLALDHLLRQPEDADGLVLLAPLIGISRRRSPLLPARAWFRLGQRAMFFTRAFTTVFPLDARDPQARRYTGGEKFMPVATYREMFAALDAVQGKAGALRIPLLMLLAPDDRVVDPRAAEAFFNQAAAPRKALRHLPRSGHVIPLDYDRDQAVAAIVDFLTPSA